MSLKYLFSVFLAALTFETVNGMENGPKNPNFNSEYDLKHKPLNSQFVLSNPLKRDELYNLNWSIAELEAEKNRLTKSVEADTNLLEHFRENVNIPPQGALAPHNQRQEIEETFLIKEHYIPEAEKKIKNLTERLDILNNYKKQHYELLKTLPSPNFDDEKAWGYSFLVNQPINPTPALSEKLSNLGSNRLQKAIKELYKKQEETQGKLNEWQYDYCKKFLELQLEDINFRIESLTRYWERHLSFLDPTEKEEQKEAFKLLLEKKEEQAPQIANQVQDSEPDDPEFQAALKAAEEEYRKKSKR